jgi:hypothetical protein
MEDLQNNLLINSKEPEEDLFFEELEQIRPKKSISVKFAVSPRKQRQQSSVEDSKTLNTNDRFRSHSHFLFKYRPEMVPQIKPKHCQLKPSPMKLCRKSSRIIINETNSFCYSCPDSDDSFSFLDEFESLSPINSKENSIIGLRKEMIQVKTFSSIMNDNVSKDYESLIQTGNIINNDIILDTSGVNTIRKKRFPFWKKYIHKLQEDQFSNWSYKNESENCEILSDKMSLSTNYNDSIYEIKKSSNKKVRHTIGDVKPSILDILECAANEKKTRQSNIY